MSTPIITACPTMANPDAFTDINELREELHRANGKMFDTAQRLHLMSGLANYLSDLLMKLILAHLASDEETIKAELTDLAEHYQREQKAKKGEIH